MAVDVVPPPATENRMMTTARGIPGFYQSVKAEMKKVTWPEVPDVRRATVAIIIFVLVLGLLIYFLDAILGYLLVNLIPRLFAGR
jgi:preprotein translocase subunit SecE